MANGEHVQAQGGRVHSAVLRAVSGLMVSIFLIVFMAPFLVLALYSLPATDDFCKASLSFGAYPQQQPSVLAVTWMYYSRWSSRWLTTFLQSSIMSHVDLAAAYGWLLILVIIANIGALGYFFKTIFQLRPASALLAAGMFYAAYVASLSDPPQEIYWLTGAIEYNLSFSTILLVVSLLYQERRQPWYYCAIFLLSFAAPAQHEIAGIFLCGLIFTVAVVLRVKKLPARHWYLSLVAAAFSLAVVVLAPGNAVRAAQEHRHMWDVSHLPRWLAHALYHGLGWPASPAILAAGCCIFLLCQREKNSSSTGAFPPSWFRSAALCGMLFVVVEVAFIETATGVWMPYRVAAWFQFMFWLLLVCLIAGGIPEFYRVRFSPGTSIGVFALLAILLLGCANFRAALEDLHGPVQTWYRTGYSRLRQHGGSLTFEPVSSYPNLTFHQNLSSDPRCFVNVCLAHYLHADAVVVKDSTEECPH
jgi:hypothetical protein